MLRSVVRKVQQHSLGCTREKILCKSSSSFSKTLLLPRTTFPQRVEGPKRCQLDNDLVESDAFQQVYHSQLRDRKGNRPYHILHDGPPYANGDPHLGHAVNKILKDITNRWKMAQGYCVHFRPGWDCHGMPIELKVLQTKTDEKMTSMSVGPAAVRSKARHFASTALQRQADAFRSWGVMGDWQRPYKTMDPDQVKAQFRLFKRLFDKGIISRGYMPVFWSPSSQSALAEAELEYNDHHVSPSVYVRFLVKQPAGILPCEDSTKKLYLVIWTTTPWTLLANKAVCVNPDATYTVLEANGNRYIVAEELLRSNADLHQVIFKADSVSVVAQVPGRMLTELKYEHPLARYLEPDQAASTLPVLCAGHVTLDAGSGLVHTAPAHGHDDYLLGVKHRLDLSCQVNEEGCYDDTVHKELRGLPVLSEGSVKILELLRVADGLLLEGSLVHSYPCDWRTKQPVLLRASMQWFVNTDALRQAALHALNEVSIYPAWAQNGFAQVLQNRPYWCLSRQRVWGTPIPVLLDRDGNAVVQDDVIEQCCRLVDQKGTDFWWTCATDELLSNTSLQGRKDVTRGADIFDVWLDSGLTWATVLQKDLAEADGPVCVADLYLEGQDQFSGWFYSSLMTSVALHGRAPFKQLVVHGFALDQNGRKMSKSLGNVVAPADIAHGSKMYGVDVLRWWVASHGSQNATISVADAVLKLSKQELDRIRNGFRFILGNVPATGLSSSECLDLEQLLPLDRYLLHLLQEHHDVVAADYDAFRYHKVCQATLHFFANHLSAFYFHLVKDRLYCCSETSPQRRSAVTALWYLLLSMRAILMPITPLLVAEMQTHILHMEPIPTGLHCPQSWADPGLAEHILRLNSTAAKIRKLLQSRTDKLKELELWFCPSRTSASVMASLRLLQTPDSSPDGLQEFFQVAAVHLDMERWSSGLQIAAQLHHPDSRGGGDDDDAVHVTVTQTRQSLCQRCRLFLASGSEQLCSRCRTAIQHQN